MHMMIDFETLATIPNSIAFSLGACLFTVDDGIFSTFETPLCVSDQARLNREVSTDTLAWWLEQSETARLASASALRKGKCLHDEIASFIEWAAENSFGLSGKDLLWSNGADFDIPILNSLLSAIGYEPITPYYNHRCFRTWKDLKNVRSQKQKTHTALQDAIDQATLIINHYQTIPDTKGILNV